MRELGEHKSLLTFDVIVEAILISAELSDN